VRNEKIKNKPSRRLSSHGERKKKERGRRLHLSVYATVAEKGVASCDPRISNVLKPHEYVSQGKKEGKSTVTLPLFGMDGQKKKMGHSCNRIERKKRGTE